MIVEEKNKKPDYVSFSSIKDWKFCANYYKITRVQGIAAGRDSIHTAFGKALHSTCEKIFKQEKEGTFDYAADFSTNFTKEIFSVPALKAEFTSEAGEKTFKEFEQQGKELAVLAFPAAQEYFGDFEFVSAEENIMEDIEEYKIDDYKFKGYIDLIIRTKKDNVYHIIDWKTCSWGWEPQRKADAMTTYQLTYYKHFYGKKQNIPADKIETHFGLLKRTAKKDRIEIFRVTSADKKTSNALKLLQECVYNVDHERFIKNKTSCAKCAFHKTVHCP